MRGYGRIANPSGTDTLHATLTRPDGVVKTFAVPPREYLAVHGRVEWPLWKFEWVRPRRGLMRFGR